MHEDIHCFWIWRRVPPLIESPGLTREQTQRRINFLHAVENFGKIAESTSLQGQSKAEVAEDSEESHVPRRNRHHVIAIREPIGHKPSRDQTTWLNHLENHDLTHRRMHYSGSAQNPLPIGSGAIESAVRRRFNPRVKSNATYLLREIAETMIRFRACVKAGRTEVLSQQTTYVNTELAP